MMSAWRGLGPAHWLLLVMVLLGGAVGTHAAGGAVSPMTPSQGDVLYREDLEDGRSQHWQLGDGWQVMEDLDGNRVLRGQGHNWARYTRDAWGDYTFKVRLKLIQGSLHLNYRVQGCKRYFIGFGEQVLYLNKSISCNLHPSLRRVRERHSRGSWHEVKIVGKGNVLTVYVDGQLRINYVDRQPLLYGGIALETLDNSEAYVDDIVVMGETPLGFDLRWKKTGGPLGGLGYDVRMRPNNSRIMYVTDAWSGVNISQDGGRTWHASNAGIITRTGPSGDAIPIFSLTIDPHNPDVIWAGTQNTRGIFQSTDAGQTWVEKDRGVVEREGITFRGFTVDPRDPDIVYAAAEVASFTWAGEERLGREFDLTQGVVYKTTDRGEHWQAIWRGDNLARYIQINPQDPDILYVSTGIFDREAANSDANRNDAGGVGIVKSTDGGRTWETLGKKNGLKNLYIGSLFMHPGDPNILLAGAGNNAHGEDSGAYLSSNAGQTWERVLATGHEPITSVEFSLDEPSIAYAGSAAAIYRSEDGGHSWHRVTGGRIWGPPGVRAGVPIDFQVDRRDSDRIFANNYGGGNFLSEDGGRTWTVASKGYTGAQLHDIAVAESDADRVYTIGRTGPFRSLNGGATWEGLNYAPATFPEWYAIALDPKSPKNVLISDEHQGTLLRSTDGGRNWTLVFRHPQVDPEGLRDRQGFKTIAFAPSESSVVYAGMSRSRRNINEGRANPSFGVYKSTDGGLTWGATNDPHTANKNINALAVDPHNERTVYAGTVNGGILKTSDGGRSWQAVNEGLHVLDIRTLAIHPRHSHILFAGAENGGIYKSTDGGATWRISGHGMDPQAAIRDIVIDPSDPEALYAADLHTGVYCSDDGGRVWVRINDGLRTRAVKALALSADGQVLYAATEGEGVFRLDVGSSNGDGEG